LSNCSCWQTGNFILKRIWQFITKTHTRSRVNDNEVLTINDQTNRALVTRSGKMKENWHIPSKNGETCW
jgi:hypothetical protein